jgi:hypothetical protein
MGSVMAKTSTSIPSLGAVMTDFLRSLSAAFSDSYRPELHYMRGPGPKWREKHGIAASPSALAATSLRRPALARFAPHEGEFSSPTADLAVLFRGGNQEPRRLARAMVTTCR